MNFETLQGLTIPEGKVTNITRKSDGKVLWNALPKFRYVSLGDSIAAGHKTDETWETEYGWDSQYRQKDPLTGEIRKETVIVPNCYTDRIRQYLYEKYGENKVDVKSFAVSGSMVYREPGDNRTLLEVIQDIQVKKALSEANLITVSIGANTILEPALNVVQEYLIQGTGLPETEVIMEDGLRVLADPKNKKSYNELFTQLTEINPNAKVVFTTVHNPMKYLCIERGTFANDFEDGFFGEWLSWIPDEYQITMDIPLVGKIELDKELKKLIIDSELLVGLRDRINGNPSEGIPAITDWVERYLELGGISANGKPYLGLNAIIRKAIKDYNNPNFVFTEIHELFDTVPDRGGAGEVHYNDLVNMQITRGYDANDMPWDALWGNMEGNSKEEKQANFWRYMFDKYLVIDWDNFTFNFNAVEFDEEFIPVFVNGVLSPAFDPHPRTDGHYLMYRSFIDTLGWDKLNTVTYNANGGSGSMATQKVLNESRGKKIYSILQPNKFTPKTGYYHTGWKDGSGNSYSDKQAVYIPNNITLNAQWNNEYVVKYYKFTDVIVDDYSKHTGHMELRSLTIGNTTRTDLNTAFALKPTKDNPCYVTVRYGDKITIHTHCKPAGWDGGLWFKEYNCDLTYPGGSKTGTDITWTFDWNLINPQKNRNIIIDYQWFYEANTDLIQRWFSWWDCHVKIE